MHPEQNFRRNYPEESSANSAQRNNQLEAFEIRTTLPNATRNLRTQLHQVCGVDLTKIPGIKEQAAQIIISEVGLDMSPWNTEKQFSSFLGLCPNNLITGGKILRRATRKGYNRAADTLRLCAQSLTHSKSALGAKYRRLRGDRRYGPSPGQASLSNVALRRKLCRKGHRALRRKIPTSTHQMAQKRGKVT